MCLLWSDLLYLAYVLFPKNSGYSVDINPSEKQGSFQCARFYHNSLHLISLNKEAENATRMEIVLTPVEFWSQGQLPMWE